MSYDHEAQILLNQKHAVNPEKGDFWSEHCMGVLQVLDVVGDVVVFFDEKIQEENTWSWDVSLPKVLTKKQFAEYVRYKSDTMNHLCWCEVYPNREL